MDVLIRLKTVEIVTISERVLGLVLVLSGSGGAIVFKLQKSGPLKEKKRCSRRCITKCPRCCVVRCITFSQIAEGEGTTRN